ncbi:MAG: hypothetical protein J5589_06640 [Firmicutes bacterium]|nr:hypothetical protein [Bacillota bacterium]
MPRYTLEDFVSSNEQRKAQILDEQAGTRVQKENGKIDKTYDAQKGKMDKLWMSIYYSIKKDAQRRATSVVSDEEKFQNGLSSRRQSSDAEDNKAAELDTKVIHAIVPEATLEYLRDIHFLVGMTIAKSTHDLAKEQQRIKASLPDTYPEETKQLLSDMLAKNGEGMANLVENYANLMLQTMGEMKAPDQAGPVDRQETYDSIMMHLLNEDMKTKLGPGIPPAMTVSQYLDLLKATPEDRASFLQANDCGAEDSLYETFGKKLDNDPEIKLLQNRAKTDEEKARIRYDQIVTAICSDYAHKMPKAWVNEGSQTYIEGLQNTERKEYENGNRIKNLPDQKRALIQKGVDYNALEKQMLHDNALSTLRTATEKVTSGKRLDMRHQPGIAEAIGANIPTARIRSRLQLTAGALENLKKINPVWKFHKTDSAKYTKFVTALKAYHEALARNDGGKIHDERNKMIKYGLEYIDGKESKRSNSNGQGRFDTVVTLLQEELKEEAFNRLINKINAKRSNNEQVSAAYYKGKKSTYLKNSQKSDRIDQEKSRENRKDDLDYRAQAHLFDMDERYAPEKRDPEDRWITTLPAVSRIPTERYHLSVRDYTALAFSSALSSPNRDLFLLEDNILMQKDAAAADGKKATDIAIKAYSEGDKIPLANLLTLGIQKLTQEAQNKNVTEKACMQEMSSRMLNMLDRDPELKKYTMRQGLKEEDIQAAKKIDAPVAARGHERNESLAEIELIH